MKDGMKDRNGEIIRARRFKRRKNIMCDTTDLI